ncbi:MBG domain-containing protein [Mucilaginibacter glaciei]|uniref:MBG domain-containing protein n=1 Tax=Mucilaginibacter glaciei TaxID=2772109 RepID=A0A926NUC2_9SPHI|nr:MBG domain-containing protein [Mucilaginibacter glaciei]MBD1394155.1 hypothetical protein [Mucilaginibacter glaciei]
MVKLYFACFLLISMLFAGNSYAQAPKIGYTSPQKLTVGVATSTIKPTSTGGAIPADVYSKASTIAGSGQYGYKDTVAAFANFASPINVAYDGNGNLYVADANLNLIRKISAAGLVSTFAGNTKAGAKNGQDTAARFNYPTGIVCDKAGNVFVADFGNNMIRKITPAGAVTTFAGNINSGKDNGPGLSARFSLPYGINIDKSGNLIVADSYNNLIRRITPSGDVSTVAGTGAQGRKDGSFSTATFQVPYSVAADSDGNIYVADKSNNCIRKISTSGFVTTITDTIYKNPVSITVDDQNRLYLATENDFSILQFDANGGRLSRMPFSGGYYKSFLNSTDTLSQYKGSMGLQFDGKNNLLVTDPLNGLIRKVAIYGYAITPRLPAGLSLDGAGGITGTPTIVSPATNYTVTAYNNNGSITTNINLTVDKGSKVITFNKLNAVTYGDADYFSPGATSTDTLNTIVYTSSNLAVATIVDNLIHVTGPGATTITASQPGNTNYNDATPVTQSLTVNKPTLNGPAISYGAIAPFTVNVAIKPITPASNGGDIPNQIYATTSTYAGSGLYGSKDTVVAKGATFSSPLSVTNDATGNVYVADANANVIRKISATGVVTTLAGQPTKGSANGQGAAASFNYPAGIAVDKAGNVYVADFGNNMIRKITPTGLVTTLAGQLNAGRANGQGTAASFTLPNSVAIDKDGNLIVADTYNNLIRKITPAGLVTTLAGSGSPGLRDGTGTAAAFRAPYSVAVNSAGYIYVADQGNKCIRGITPSGIVKTITDTIYNEPIGIAVDNLNRIYLSTAKAYTILQFNSNGKPTGTVPFSGNSSKSYTDGLDTLAGYKGNMGLKFDGQGSLLIADAFNSVIRKVTVAGFSISPQLPVGLSIDGKGVISGTPTIKFTTTDYVVTAYNNSGIFKTTVNLSVAIGTRTITFKTPAPVTYGIADFNPGATGTDTLAAITYTSSNAAVATIVNNKVHLIGAGTTTITASQAGDANYTAATPVQQPLVVNKAILTVTANDIIKTEAKDNPSLTLTYDGFVNGQDTTILTKKPVAQTTVVTGTAVGVYPITVSGGDAANYSFNYVAGKLTVFPVPVITSVGSTTIVKGGSVVLKASPSSGYKYQWTLYGTPIPGATDSTFTATQTGSYNVNITANKYTTYSLYTNVLAQLKLSADNFKLRLVSVSCKGSNNGSIHITAGQKLKYTAVVTGNGFNTSLPFTDSLAINSLSPGNYSVCFTIEGETFLQCYQVNITEPKDLSVYSVVNRTLNNINLQLDGGSTFTIMLNGAKYTTSQHDVTLPLLSGTNKMTITTDNLCQGIVEREINLSDKITPFPNPFSNVLYVNIGDLNIKNINVNIVGLTDGKPAYNKQYTNKSGILEIDLSAIANGFYYLNLGLDNKQSGYKIIKK